MNSVLRSWKQVAASVEVFTLPVYTVYTTEAVVENVDEIAQASSCARVYKHGRYSRAGGIGIDAKGATIGLRGVPQKPKKCVQERSHLFPALREYSFPEKNTRLSCKK